MNRPRIQMTGNRNRLRLDRGGFKLVELVVVLGVCVVLAGMMLPATRRVRGASERTDCANRLRQLTLSTHSFHDANKHFPTPVGMTLGDHSNQALSGLVQLLPYMERGSFFEEIVNPLRSLNTDYPPLGPDPLTYDYSPWRKTIPDFICPTSMKPSSELGYSNYTMCIGDVANGIHSPRVQRGAFAIGRTCSMDDVTDGTSVTILFAETGTSGDRDKRGQFAINQSPKILNNPEMVLGLVDEEDAMQFREQVELSKRGRGGSWADGMSGHSLVNTILPPGSPSAAVMGNRGMDGYYSANSFHPAGVNVGLVDGSVRCINRGIDAGNATAAPLTQEEMAMGGAASPYGVWGALGTIAGEEAYPLNF